MSPQRIVIVDDHPILVRGLHDIIQEQRDLEVVAEAANATEAIVAIETHRPDLIITDISLPGTNGFTLIQDIRARWATLPIVVFSRHDSVNYAERALKAGAQAYISKKDDPDAILAAIRNALQGKISLSGNLSEQLIRLAYKFRGTGKQASPAMATEDVLSNRELEVFEAMGHGYDTESIADLLHMSPRTVESHRRNIKEKLGVAGLYELVRRAVLWVERTG